MKYQISVSQNGWEYTGCYTIECQKGIEEINDRTLLIDGTIRIEFDEEIVIEFDEN